MNYTIFSKIIVKTNVFSYDYKKNLLLEAKDFFASELLEIAKFVYSEEEKNENIIFDNYIEPIIKTKQHISKIKKSGVYLNKLLQLLQKNIQPGMKLSVLEKLAKDFLQKNHVKGSFKGVDNYRYNISVSINDKIIHGIPNHYTLKLGDVITIDTGVDYKGGMTDSAFSMIVGGNDNNYIAWKMLYLLKTTLDKHIKNFKPGYNMYDFSFHFYNDIVGYGLNIIKNSSGHGVGGELHEAPNIYHWPCEYMKNICLKPGMVLAIEPLITGETSFALYDKKDIGYTRKGDIGGYFEYTILITETGYEIVSGPKDMIIPELKINYEIKEVTIGNKKYLLEIADTKNKQRYGLMFRESLDYNKGMLFNFNKSNSQTFTMNHTFVDLDIIGLNKDFEIVYLKENIKNYFDIDYEEFIHIDKKVRYIIELKSGEISHNSIQIKDVIKIL